MNVSKHESLGDRVARWRTALAASDTGPLIVAKEVMELANEWELYRQSQGGISCSAFLQNKLGRPKSLAWFARRDHAVKKLGEAVRRTLHHLVAIWIVNVAPEARWKECVEALMFARKKNGGNPVSMGMAIPIVRRIIGRPARPRVGMCSRCAQLDELLRHYGIEVPK